MNYKSPQFNRDYAVWAAGRRPRRLSIYLTELTVHGGSSELTGGRLTAMWSAVLVGGGRAAGQMPKLVVGALVDQGRLARITLPDGAEVLRSTAAGSLEQLAVRLDDELAPILHQHRLSIYPGQLCHCHPRRLSIYAETGLQVGCL